MRAVTLEPRPPGSLKLEEILVRTRAMGICVRPRRMGFCCELFRVDPEFAVSVSPTSDGDAA
jgi:hypothetical protein